MCLQVQLRVCWLRTCSAWMSKMTMLAGPPRVSGMWDSMRASVNAVATSPSASTCIAQDHASHRRNVREFSIEAACAPA